MPLKINYSLQRHFQLEPKNLRASQRMSKLGQRLRAAIRTVLEVLPEAQVQPFMVLVSGNDCVSGKKQQIDVLVSLFMALFGSFTLQSPIELVSSH